MLALYEIHHLECLSFSLHLSFSSLWVKEVGDPNERPRIIQREHGKSVVCYAHTFQFRTSLLHCLGNFKGGMSSAAYSMFLLIPSRNDSTLTIGCSRHASCLTERAFVEQYGLLRNSQSSSPGPSIALPHMPRQQIQERVSFWGSSAFAFCHPSLC